MNSFAISLSWMGLAVAVSKLSSIVTQVVLGYLLLPEQFGNIAFLIGGMALIAGFIDTGISKFLIRSQHEIGRYRSSAIIITSGMAIIGGSLLLLYVWLNKMPTEVWLAAIPISLCLPIFALSQIDKASLSIALELPCISRIEVGRSLLYSATLILMAYLGYGIVGFGLATAAGYCYTGLKYRLAVQHRIKLLEFTTEQRAPPISLIWELRWLILTTFAMGFALRGDYVVLGGLINQAELGIYYFAFMLTANVGLLIAAGINSAFMPYLATKSSTPKELRDFFLENSLAFIFVTSLLAGGFICLGGIFVKIIWQGRWDPAVLPAILLAITLPLKMLAPVSYALLEAQGMWKKRFTLIAADAFTMALAVAIGAKTTGFIGAVAALAFQRGIIGAVIFFSTCQWTHIGITYRHVLASLFSVLMMSFLAYLVTNFPQVIGTAVGLLILIPISFITLPFCAPSLHHRISTWRRKWIAQE